MRSAVEFGAQRVLTGSAIFPAQAQNVSNNIVPIRSGEHEIGHGLVRGLQRGGNCATGHAWRVGKRRKAWCVKMRGYPFAWPNRMALRAIGLHKQELGPPLHPRALEPGRMAQRDLRPRPILLRHALRLPRYLASQHREVVEGLQTFAASLLDVRRYRMLCWHYPTPRS